MDRAPVISILVVDAEAAVPLPSDDPSVEILLARGADEAVEKLARNRRIDAVLLLCGPETSAIHASILEEEPAPPPFYAVAEWAGRGVRRLAPAPIRELIAAIAADLGN